MMPCSLVDKCPSKVSNGLLVKWSQIQGCTSHHSSLYKHKISHFMFQLRYYYSLMDVINGAMYSRRVSYRICQIINFDHIY